MRIRDRLLIVLLAGLAGALLLGGSVVYLVARQLLVHQFDARLEARAHTVAALVKYEPDGLIFEVGDAPEVPIERTWYVLRTDAGEEIRRSANLSAFTLPTDLAPALELRFADCPLPDAIPGRSATLRFDARIDPDDWTDEPMPSAAPERLVVTVALDRRPVDRSLHALAIALLGLFIVLALVTGAALWFGLRWSLRPLGRFQRDIESFDATSASPPAASMTIPEELQPVHRALHRMFERVADSVERERLFTRAAAHELRTPLAELRSTTEVALRFTEPDRHRSALTEVLEITAEMQTLVESLLLISRATEGELAPPEDSAVSAGAIVARLWPDALERGGARHLTMTCDCSSAHGPVAPSGVLLVILRNLLDNAVRYTDPRGHIVVTTAPDDPAVLVISNGPVDLAPADLDHLFDPFWRKESARSDRTHSGLGLSIVRHAARGAGLTVETRLGERTFSVCLGPGETL